MVAEPLARTLAEKANHIDRFWTEEWVMNAWHDQQAYPPYRLAVWLEAWYREYGVRPSSYSLTGYRWVITDIGRGIARTAVEMTIADLVDADDDHRFVTGFDGRLDDFRANLRLLCRGTLRELVSLGAPEPAFTDRYWDGVFAHPQFDRGWREATQQILAWLDATPIAKAA